MLGGSEPYAISTTAPCSKTEATAIPTICNPRKYSPHFVWVCFALMFCYMLLLFWLCFYFLQMQEKQAIYATGSALICILMAC